MYIENLPLWFFFSAIVEHTYLYQSGLLKGTLIPSLGRQVFVSRCFIFSEKYLTQCFHAAICFCEKIRWVQDFQMYCPSRNLSESWVGNVGVCCRYKYLRWVFLRKWQTAFSRQRYLQKAPSTMFKWDLNFLIKTHLNPLSANLTNGQTHSNNSSLSVFDHFVRLALKGLRAFWNLRHLL